MKCEAFHIYERAREVVVLIVVIVVGLKDLIPAALEESGKGLREFCGTFSPTVSNGY